MAGQKTLFSGVQSSGRAHIGNYLGAMRQFVTLQDEYRSFFMLADYHSLTTVQDAAAMRENILNLALDYLAIGLDPRKSIIFKQSDVSEHTELAWIFDCITTMPYLMRAHAFKDAGAKSKEINVGLFNYPMLMAADILLYDVDIVPVGQDQKQHVEYARDTAEKFNHLFGETFKLPEPYIPKEVAVVSGTDGRKMSKSYRNTIPLFAESKELEEAVMSIVTDSKGTGEPKDKDMCNVFALHRFFSQKELPELEERYRKGSIGYQESKEVLLRNLEAFIAPLRERRKKFEEDKKGVLRVLQEGGNKAREIASAKMKAVREKVGVTLS